MSKNKPHFVYSVFILVLLQLLRKCCARSFFAVENNLVGIFNNNHDNEIGFTSLHNPITNDNHSYLDISKPTTTFISTINSKQFKKWSMDSRFTRRQYEIINMLWRKTKIFIDQPDNPNQELSSTISAQNNITTKTLLNLIEHKDPVVFTARLPVVQITSTPSNIEFYYFNDPNNKEDTTKKNCILGTKCKETIAKTFNLSNTKKSNSSFVVFHIKGPAIGESKEKWYASQRLQTTGLQIIHDNIFFTTCKPNFFDVRTKISHSASVALKKKAYTNIFNITSNKAINNSVSNKNVLNGSCSPTATKGHIFLKGFRNNVGTTESYKGTTAYDKIKFFEIYDRMTPTTSLKNQSEYLFDYGEELSKPNEAENEKILLSHVNQGSHDHDKAKHIKKHITENQNIDISCLNSNEENKTLTKYVFKRKNVKKNATHHLIELKRKSLADDILYTFSNKTVHWSEYPFAAVYVYEPSQIHCDAAGISEHWLVASGSCLSRLNKNPNGEGRSAFVTYCGENWWHPERVSYVKYCLVHPWFHPTDKTRRHLYNIGVIQVVTSMTTCSGWAPVSLMSHQFTTAQKGTLASAVGWGLDRFGTRFSATMRLPKIPITVYNGLLFSDSCPGNYEYSDAKLFGDNGYLRSLYCLSLPPYFGEDRDPVHGGLLLVDGKLIALYLQEERRPWGEQSAQYTGVWRLIPWIMDVARETDDIGTAYIEM